MFSCRNSILLLLLIVCAIVESCEKANNESDVEACSSSIHKSGENIRRYYENRYRDRSQRSVDRYKRSDATSFVGHPKTREERWHATFGRNSDKLKTEQAQSLVLLLNKVIDRYMNACIPIILYDTFIDESDGIILQRFFQVRCSFDP